MSNQAEWLTARHDRRLRERRLPTGLREDVTKIRRDDIAGEVLDSIFEGVLQACGGESPVPVVERKALRALNQSKSFRGRVRNEVARLLRSAHLVKTDPEAVTDVPHLDLRDRAWDGQPIRLRSDIGLGTATYLEAEPEEWCQYVVQRIVGDLKADEVSLEGRTLLVAGAGPGGLARVVAALNRVPPILIEEVDLVLPEATNLPCVVGRGTASSSYDAIVSVIGAPGIGGAVNHRRIYRDDDINGLARDRPRFDFTGVGPNGWTKLAFEWLRILETQLRGDGRAYLLVPASFRFDRGYQRAPELLEHFLDSTKKAGFKVLEKQSVIEVEPVKQPFVGCNRPDRWSLVLERAHG